MNDFKTAVVIPHWNNKEDLGSCLDSLKEQSLPIDIIVVDNGSVDGSPEFIEQNYPKVHLIRNSKNYGFTGGVNPGLQYALDNGYRYAALLNNDAIADKNWINQLVSFMEDHKKAGIATSKICDSAKTHLDSTGDLYTIWGLPYPRGRGEEFSDKYDDQTWVFGASGGASIYRVEMLKQIGLFDQDFFAYYEDIDISFRAQLAGWKVGFVPSALVYHQISATSSKIKGFATYQTMKNLPFLFIKNVPGRLFWTIEPRLEVAYWSFFFSAFRRGQGWPATKGYLAAWLLLPKKLWQRHQIQSQRKVSIEYIDSIIYHDLPPNARKLKILRSKYRKLLRRPTE